MAGGYSEQPAIWEDTIRLMDLIVEYEELPHKIQECVDHQQRIVDKKVT